MHYRCSIFFKTGLSWKKMPSGSMCQVECVLFPALLSVCALHRDRFFLVTECHPCSRHAQSQVMEELVWPKIPHATVFCSIIPTLAFGHYITAGMLILTFFYVDNDCSFFFVIGDISFIYRCSPMKSTFTQLMLAFTSINICLEDEQTSVELRVFCLWKVNVVYHLASNRLLYSHTNNAPSNRLD